MDGPRGEAAGDGETSVVRALERTRQRLRAQPALARHFDAAMGLLCGRPGLSVAVSGSLATGELDQYSDLDFEVVVHDSQSVGATVAWLRRELPGVGELVALFPATHLGLANLLISFFVDGSAVAKADLWVMGVENFAAFSGAQLVHDPDLGVSRALAELEPGGASPTPDFPDLMHKFVGWMWYTASKIGRGEYFEAYDSLHVMRSRVLVPCIQAVENLPYEGYRRVERRFSARRLEQLRSTVATGPSETELRASLLAMVDVFDSLSHELGAFMRTELAPDLVRMRAVVSAEFDGALA